MGPRGFWIALAIVLFYLIARPRIGTVWYVATPPPAPLPSGAKPLPGFVPYTPPPRAFTDERDCDFAVGPFRQDGGYCDSRYALLWGW